MSRSEFRKNFNLILIIVLLLLVLTRYVNSFDIESNNYTITIHEDGVAEWLIESKIPLNSEEELKAFLDYVENFDKHRGEILENFTKRIFKIVRDVSLQVGREMRVENVEVSVDIIESIIGKIGLIRYKFKWIGFAHNLDGKIAVGDVFIGGFYLYDGDALIITIPVNYTISEVYPPPDRIGENYVVWYGKKVFPDRTPSLTLSREKFLVGEAASTGEGTTLRTETPWSTHTLETVTSWSQTDLAKTTYNLFFILPLTATIAILAIAILLFLRVKHSRERFTVKDAEIILKVIKELGGTAYQKKIVEKTGFSKSKVSEILKALEKNKVIEKVKVGREHLIILKKKDY